jgi:transposase
MEANVQYVGIDVDDQAYHISVYNDLDGSSFEFKCGPSPDFLIRALKNHKLHRESIKICYEASYIGFSIYRRLAERGYTCQVVAPSLIPKQPGVRQKTDKLDSKKLAMYYAKGLLTFIYIPDETDEAVRDLLRSKRCLIELQTTIKNHINSLCRRLGLDYRQETDKKTRWTKHHLEWLSAKVSKLKQDSAKLNFRILLKQFEDTTANIELYDSEIDHIGELPRYEKKVAILSAFKGVKTATALTLITELGDIRRFDHPRRVTSYAGFDLVEYSSGGTEKRFGISKFGNPNIRRAAVDAVKFTIRSPKAGADVTKRRKGLDPETAKIASRCSSRLYKKGTPLLYAGKPTKKVQVACAREFLGFVWEALQKAA